MGLGMRRPALLVALVAALAGLTLLMAAGLPALGRAGGNVGEPSADAVIVRFPAAGASVAVEVARTPEERQRGLMGRRELADGSGMLFVFPQDTTGAFWMKDTYVPLSIAFIDERGTIVDIQAMQPLDERLHVPAAAYRYALEVPQGWYDRVGVAVGQAAELPRDQIGGAS